MGLLPTFMSSATEPAWSRASNEPVPVPVKAVGSAGELSWNAKIIRYPGALIEVDAAFATGSSTLEPQPATASADTHSAVTMKALRNARGV